MRNTPDPRALMVAEQTWQEEELDAAILFGSRARGDHRPDSDVDIMVLTRGPVVEPRLKAMEERANARTRLHYASDQVLPCKTQLVTITISRYRRTVNAVNSLCAQAAREGVTFSTVPQLWLQTLSDTSSEDLIARENARKALQTLDELARTMVAGNRTSDGPDPTDAWYEAQSAVHCAVSAILCDARVPVPKGATVSTLMDLATWHTGEYIHTAIQPLDYDIQSYKYPKLHQETFIPARMTTKVRRDVDAILRTCPELHLWAERRRWTRARRNRAKKQSARAQSPTAAADG